MRARDGLGIVLPWSIVLGSWCLSALMAASPVEGPMAGHIKALSGRRLSGQWGWVGGQYGPSTAHLFISQLENCTGVHVLRITAGCDGWPSSYVFVLHAFF